MQRIIHLVIIALLTFIILKSTTFGWRFFFDSLINQKLKDLSIVERIKNHVYRLSSEIGNRNIYYYNNLEKAAVYITEQFKTYGYQAQFQEYILGNRKTKNIIATKKGTKSPEEIIIVGAHYDSCFNPGADDNASGIAALLELSRFMVDKKTGLTIKFIAFVNEEPPYYRTEDMGSRIYVRQAKARNETIKAVIILESIGYYSGKINSQRYPPLIGIFYPNQANFIAVVGNFKSRHLVSKIIASFKKYSKFPIFSSVLDFIPGADFSDHWSFWKEGFPAVMITDTAFLRNPHYHRDSDTWEKLSYENMTWVIEGFCSVMIELAK